jgi:hypothetical protein
MINKIHVFYVLLSCFGLSMNSAFALDCDFVARIFPLDDIAKIEILRLGKKSEKASSENRRLCPGDIVNIPKSIPDVKIKYQSNTTLIVKAGKSHKVIALAKPCQASCKLKAFFEELYEQFTMTEPSKIKLQGVGTKGNDKSSPIKMPLAASEGSDYEFFLSANNSPIPLFWYGGKAPYKLIVRDSAGKLLVQQQLEKPEYSLTLPNAKIGSTYSLTIQSADTLFCNKYNSKICQKPLLIEALPELPDYTKAMENLVGLLANCEDKNWRLEIWRQLSLMPDSEAKQNFMQHLAENDIDLYDFELCE